MSQINTTQWKKDVSRERKQKYIFKNTESRRFVELMKKCADKLGTKSTVEFFDRLGREMGVREYSALIGLCISKARNCSNKEDSMVIGTRLGCTAKIDRRRLIEEEKREEVEEERRRRGEEERSTSRRPRPCATPPASHPLASAVRGLPVNRRRPRSPANRRRPLSWAIFLLREEAERLPARGERSKRLGLRFAISTCNARYGWYIPVRQVAVAVETKVFLTEQSGSYRMVCTGLAADRYADRPLPAGTAKIDRRRSISAVGGRLREKSTIGGRLRKKKGRGRRRRRGKEERRRGEEIPRTPSLPAGHPRALATRGSSASLCRPWATFLPAWGERSRQ
ncbi:hypothetical protein BHE74_00054221, partial [Ensete ventricosum]